MEEPGATAKQQTGSPLTHYQKGTTLESPTGVSPLTALSAVPGSQVSAKHLLEGSTSLIEAAIALDLYSSELRRLHVLGWTLAKPIGEAGIGFLVPPGATAVSAENLDAAEAGVDIHMRVLCLECGVAEVPYGHDLCSECKVAIGGQP